MQIQRDWRYRHQVVLTSCCQQLLFYCQLNRVILETKLFKLTAVGSTASFCILWENGTNVLIRKPFYIQHRDVISSTMNEGLIVSIEGFSTFMTFMQKPVRAVCGYKLRKDVD